MNAYNPITEAPKSKTDQAKQQEHQPEIRQNLAKHQIGQAPDSPTGEESFPHSICK